MRGAVVVVDKKASGWVFCLAALLLAMVGCREASDETCLQSALRQPELTGGRVVLGERSGHRLFVDLRDGSIARSPRPLRMASLTKPMVAGEIRRRVNAGVLSLDAPVSGLLPGHTFAAPTGAITLRQLLQHQGGFDRSHLDPVLIDGRKACLAGVEYVAGRPPEQHPGRSILYSNVGYCLLGEILLRDPRGLPGSLQQALQNPLGGAGGWRTTLGETYDALRRTLPVQDLPSLITLPDGSYYGYGWKHWPAKSGSPAWTHFGRLPGMVSIAATDGHDRLLVAHFSGDPADPERTSQQAVRQLWRCVE